MLKASLTCILLFLAGTLSAVAMVGVDLPTEIPDEPLDITAGGGIEYLNEMMKGSSGVTGRFENATVLADSFSGNLKTGDLHLEGDILFERDTVIWQGTELDYNYITQTGSFGPSSLNFDPILMSIDQVERVSTNESLLKGARFTTCKEDPPHFHVKAKEGRLIDEQYFNAKGVGVYVGKVPILYVPYWRQNLEKSIFHFGAGFGSEWGAYGLINATVPITQHVDSCTANVALVLARDLNGTTRMQLGSLPHFT